MPSTSSSSSSSSGSLGKEGFNYLSTLRNVSDITNPIFGSSTKMQFSGHFIESENGLKTTRASSGRMFIEDASKVVRSRSGYISMDLTLPDSIVNGVHEKVAGDTSELNKIFIWGVNLGETDVSQPGFYAAFTPDGIEFKGFTSSFEFSIFDTETSIPAGETVKFEFVWGESIDAPKITMMSRVNKEISATGNAPFNAGVSDADFNNVQLDILGNAFDKSKLECEISELSIYNVVPRTVVDDLNSSSSSESSLSSSSSEGYSSSSSSEGYSDSSSSSEGYSDSSSSSEGYSDSSSSSSIDSSSSSSGFIECEGCTYNSSDVHINYFGASSDGFSDSPERMFGYFAGNPTGLVPSGREFALLNDILPEYLDEGCDVYAVLRVDVNGWHFVLYPTSALAVSDANSFNATNSNHISGALTYTGFVAGTGAANIDSPDVGVNAEVDSWKKDHFQEADYVRLNGGNAVGSVNYVCKFTCN
jgi:hypothetical protein